jgi:hypothetical protein
MQELRWLEHLPTGTIEGGVEILNELYWNISHWEYEGKYFVKTGEKLFLLRIPSKQWMLSSTEWLSVVA